jgi:hypothetical protein
MKLFQSPDTGEDRILIEPSSVLNDVYDLIPEYRDHVKGSIALAKAALKRLGDRGEDFDFFQLLGDTGLLIVRLIDHTGEIYTSTGRTLEDLDINLDSMIGIGLFYSQKMSGIITSRHYNCSGKVEIEDHSFSVQEFVETLDALVEARIWTLGY